MIGYTSDCFLHIFSAIQPFALTSAGSGVDSAWEQRKLEARKILDAKRAAESHTADVWGFPLMAVFALDFQDGCCTLCCATLNWFNTNNDLAFRCVVHIAPLILRNKFRGKESDVKKFLCYSIVN